MKSDKHHWTEDDIESYVYRIGFDFVTYISELLDSGNLTQAELAGKFQVTEGRVSQILNDPGNLSLKLIVKLARALGKKVSIVGYDDGDSENINGPVSAAVFVECWKGAGKPADLIMACKKPKPPRFRIYNFTANIGFASATKTKTTVVLGTAGTANSLAQIAQQGPHLGSQGSTTHHEGVLQW